MTELYRNLERFYENNLMTQNRRDKYMRVFEMIERKIKEIYPYSNVELFGSFENGFESKYSDLDIAVVCYLWKSKERRHHLSQIDEVLKNNFPSIAFETLLEPKVPIIKFSMTDGIRGDISINNNNALKNTKLLKLFCELHPVVSSLGVLLKCMAKHFGIKDAADGYLSSYAYMIMLVHFLQTQGALPVLQELPGLQYRLDGCWSKSDKKLIKSVWKPAKSGVSLDELWKGFFRYYLTEFDMRNKVVSINQSRIISKQEKRWDNHTMAIEDPLKPLINIARQILDTKYKRIKSSFKKALENKGNPFKWSDEIDEPSNTILIPSQLPVGIRTKRSSENISESIKSVKRRKF